MTKGHEVNVRFSSAHLRGSNFPAKVITYNHFTELASIKLHLKEGIESPIERATHCFVFESTMSNHPNNATDHILLHPTASDAMTLRWPCTVCPET